MQPVPMSQAQASLSYIVLPKDTNPGSGVHGSTLHGGRYLTLLDETSYCAAMNFCRRHIVTVRFDGALTRVVPVGHVVRSQAQVIYAGHTSMLVRVVAQAEDMRKGEVYECARCYFTCTAVDDQTLRPVPVPPLVAETEEQRQWLEEGKARMEAYKRQREQG